MIKTKIRYYKKQNKNKTQKRFFKNKNKTQKRFFKNKNKTQKRFFKNKNKTQKRYIKNKKMFGGVSIKDLLDISDEKFKVYVNQFITNLKYDNDNKRKIVSNFNNNCIHLKNEFDKNTCDLLFVHIYMFFKNKYATTIKNTNIIDTEKTPIQNINFDEENRKLEIVIKNEEGERDINLDIIKSQVKNFKSTNTDITTLVKKFLLTYIEILEDHYSNNNPGIQSGGDPFLALMVLTGIMLIVGTFLAMGNSNN
jgi:hypothetical protein